MYERVGDSRRESLLNTDDTQYNTPNGCATKYRRPKIKYL